MKKISAAESKSRPEVESFGVELLSPESDLEPESIFFAESDSVLVLQTMSIQRMIILAEWLSIPR